MKTGNSSAVFVRRDAVRSRTWRGTLRAITLRLILMSARSAGLNTKLGDISNFTKRFTIIEDVSDDNFSCKWCDYHIRTMQNLMNKLRLKQLLF